MSSAVWPTSRRWCSTRPSPGVRQTFSYVDLLQRVAQLGGALRGLGVGPGDRVVLSLPLVPELVMAMLACARIGAVHAVVDADLSPAELAARIDDAEPQVVISASCRLEAGRVVAGKPLLDAALAEASHQPPHCVILQRDQLRADLEAPRDLDFAQLMRPPIFEPAICADLAATDPLYIVYASGPAGEPNRMVRDQGGHAVALAYLMGTGYEVRVGAVVLTAADAAGVVAQSVLVYGPLLVKATTVLYEGEPSDSAAFWRAVAEHRVQVLVTTPARLRALAPGGFAAGGDLTTLQAVFLAGDRSDADIAGWAEKTLGVPVVDQWWPTRIGSSITTSRRPLDPTLARSGTPSVPLPGFDVVALGPDGAVLAPGQRGALCLRRPLPPGTLTTDADGARRLAAADPLAAAGYHPTSHRGYVDDEGHVYRSAGDEAAPAVGELE